MQVGDLVCWRGGVGILIRLISDDPIIRERLWLVQWSDGKRDLTRERFMEVAHASR